MPSNDSTTSNVTVKDSTLRQPANYIRVALPPRFMNDQKRINKLIGELTGCEGCHSGFSIEFVLANQYRINPATERLEAY